MRIIRRIDLFDRQKCQQVAIVLIGCVACKVQLHTQLVQHVILLVFLIIKPSISRKSNDWDRKIFRGIRIPTTINDSLLRSNLPHTWRFTRQNILLSIFPAHALLKVFNIFLWRNLRVSRNLWFHCPNWSFVLNSKHQPKHLEWPSWVPLKASPESFKFYEISRNFSFVGHIDLFGLCLRSASWRYSVHSTTTSALVLTPEERWERAARQQSLAAMLCSFHVRNVPRGTQFRPYWIYWAATKPQSGNWWALVLRPHLHTLRCAVHQRRALNHSAEMPR